MERVYKYVLPYPITGLDVPLGARFVSAAWVRGEVVVYAVVDIYERRVERRTLLRVGTGQDSPIINAPFPTRFIGTVISLDERSVQHIFEYP